MFFVTLTFKADGTIKQIHNKIMLHNQGQQYIWFYVSTVPSTLTVNITKNIESLSIVVQWDAVDDSLPTTYIVTWISEAIHIQSAALIEQTSYTITGLTLDTVYTITVTAANKCGQGPEFATSVSFSTDTTSAVSSITPTITASIDPTTIVSTAHASTINTISVSPKPTASPSNTTSKLKHITQQCLVTLCL